jgi:pyruvate dehydrogenase phosphatase
MNLKSIDLVASLNDPLEAELHNEGIVAATQDSLARNAPPLDYDRATEVLKVRSGFSVTPKAVSHFTQAPSNLPCEDTMGSGTYNFLGDPAKDWSEWGIYDGHAGPRTAQLLKDSLPIILGTALDQAKCMVKPVEEEVVRTIKATFLKVDDEIVERTGELIKAGGSLPEIVSAGATAFSGSCALVAMYDPVREVLRVANVGDSRAVLGRWDSARNQYVAHPLSVDQTGFNQNEVDRLARDHPNEDVVDPKSGRVHGIAISRAFGDARWKWPESLTQLAHRTVCGPAPRPNGVIKTPPYLTAEPDVMSCNIQSGARPDFLIMVLLGHALRPPLC